MATVNFTIEGNEGLFSGQSEINFETLMKDYILSDNSVKDMVQEKFESIVKKIDADKISDGFQKQISSIFNLDATDVTNFKADIKNIYKNSLAYLQDHIEESMSSFKMDIPEIKIEDVQMPKSVKESNLYANESGQPKSMFGLGRQQREQDIYANETTVSEISIVDVSEDAVKKFSKMFGKDPDAKKKYDVSSESDDFKKSGGIWKFLADIFGITAILGSVAAFKMAIMTKIASAFGAARSGIFSLATNPITMLIAGISWAVIDGVRGVFKMEEWGVSGTSGFVGALMGGMSSGILGAFKNAGKWALIGAGIGVIGGPVGSILGGVAGGVIGGLLGFFGGEKIANAIDPVASWIEEKFKILGKLYLKFAAFVMPKFLRELIGLNDDGTISGKDSIIGQKISEKGFVGGMKEVGKLIYTRSLKAVATAMPNFIRELIGMDENGKMDSSKSLIVTDFKQGGFIGGSYALFSRIIEQIRFGIAKYTPLWLRELIGMDERGVIDFASSQINEMVQEKGVKFALVEVMSIFGERMRGVVAKFVPDWVKTMIGMNEKGEIDFAQENFITAMGDLFAGNPITLAELGGKVESQLHAWMWSKIRRVPFIDKVLKFENGQILFADNFEDAMIDTVSGAVDFAKDVKEKTKTAVKGAMDWTKGILTGSDWDASIDASNDRLTGQNPEVKKVNDGVLENGRFTYIQPHESDKLVNLTSNTSAVAKPDGFLDKKFDEMIKVLKDQVLVLTENADYLSKMLASSIQSVDQLVMMNGTLPALAPIPPAPPTTQFSDSDSRDVIQEYRTKNFAMRGV